jgi:hypothetical protein
MGRPIRRLMVIVSLGMLFPVGLAGEGLARPIGGCPTDRWILDAAPGEDPIGSPSVDGNGDGLSCYLEAPVGGGIFTIIDNRVVRP